MVERPGERARYDIGGPIGAPAIVFIHGAAGTRAMWRPQMQTLASEFRVIAPDLPGHGVLASEPFRLVATVRVIQETIESAAQGRAFVVGLSLGGYAAMAHAARHPEQVAGLVLSGCCIDYRGALGMLSRLDARLVTRLVSQRRLMRMQGKTLHRMLPSDLADTLLAAGFTFDVMPAVYRELSRHDFTTLLRQFPGPTLILNGEGDRLNRKGEGRMLQVARRGELRVISGAGHVCNLEQPQAFSEAVRGFVHAHR